MFSKDMCYQDALADEIYRNEHKPPQVSEHYILSGKLFNNRDELIRNGTRLYGDAGHIWEQCSKLATELLNYPDHKLHKLIK
jgi:uncharacterized Zn-finger protein|tara:strand:+ start:22336 stop:22581 length:246 start_codon:yes stop_codon:yes gene_type:complete